MKKSNLLGNGSFRLWIVVLLGMAYSFSPIQAAILVNADFDTGYATGTLIGQSGSSDAGLAGSFAVGAITATGTVVNSTDTGRDLTYTVSGGGTISGGSHSVNIAGALGVSQDVFHRTLSSDIKGQSLFMRVVVRPESAINAPTYLRFYLTPAAPPTGTLGGLNGIKFGLHGTGPATGLGPSAEATLHHFNGNDYSAYTSPGALAAGVASLFVAKFNWNAELGKYDSVSIWVNPTASASESPLATATVLPFTPTSLSVMGLGIANFHTSQMIAIDSYAVGTQWADVVPTLPDPNLVFLDSFDNGSLSSSDTEAGVWTLSTPQTSTAVESGGELVQSASAADASTVITGASTAPEQRFNFFDRQLKFDAAIRMGPADATNTPTTRLGRFILSSAEGGGTASPDTFSLLYTAENSIELDTKMDGPDVDPNATSAYISSKINTFAGSFINFPPYKYNYTHQFHLAIDSNRYRLVSNVTSDGSVRARFSGEHGIDRSKWGAGGDSSLILEAMRTGAPTGTSATASWDYLKVEASSQPLLNEPVRTINVTFTNSSGVPRGSSFCLWVPSTEPVIRGIIFVGPGTGMDFRYFAFDPMVQEAARSIGFGIMAYLVNDTFTGNIGGADYALAKQTIQTAMSRAAEVSGHAEIANAPICCTGFSLGASDSVNMAIKWPERTIAYVAQHYGAGPPVNPPAALLKVPGLFVAGSTDWTHSIIESYVYNWRSLGAQVALTWAWDVNHTLLGNQGWESTWTWLIETANLRYPRSLVPGLTPGQIPTLINLADNSGWAGNTITSTPSFVTNPFMTVVPYASYTGLVSTSSWYPNETCARIFRAQTSTDLGTRTLAPSQTPLRIVSPKQYGEQVPVGESALISVDPRDFDDVRAISSMEFYDGSTLLGTVTNGPNWSLSFVPAESGLHSLSVVATDTDGNKGSAFRALFVSPTDYLPVAYPQLNAMAAGAGLSGTVTGLDPEGGAVTFAPVDEPLHGQLLSFNTETGSFTYQSDADYGGLDSFTFASVSGGVTGSASSVMFDVAPSEASGFLGFSATTMKVNKTAGSATLTVNRSGETAGAVSIHYETSDSSAVTGTHYTAAGGTLNWADGDSAPKTFTVPVINTASPQLPRQFKVTLSNPTGGALLGSAVSCAVLIEDPSATLGSPWSQTVLGTLTDSSPAVNAEGALGDAAIGGSGASSGATSDQGRFIYQSRTGDGVLTALVPAPVPTQAAGRFAVMVRATLSSNSPMVAAVTTSGDAINYGTKQVIRAAISAGASVTPTTHNNQSAPYWLRLTRAGNSFTAQSSADGTNWTLLSSVTLTNIPETANWGLFHCSEDLDSSTGLGDYQLAMFENISFGAPPIPGMPAGLSNFTFLSDRVILVWTMDSFAAGYRIERRTWTNSFVQIAGVPAQSSYADYAIAAGGEYEYRIQAYNASGDSPWSAGTLAFTPPADQAADDDGDGFSNGQEFLALTDPQNSNDFLRVGAVIESSSGTPFTLQWPAKGGVRYRVTYSDDLITWSDIERSAGEETQPGAYGESGTASFTDDWILTPPPAGAHRFYRIRVL
jgi:hypothetical protein